MTDAIGALRKLANDLRERGADPLTTTDLDLTFEELGRQGFSHSDITAAAGQLKREAAVQIRLASLIGQLGKALGLKRTEGNMTVREAVERAYATDNKAAIAIVEQLEAAAVDLMVLRGELPVGGTA